MLKKILSTPLIQISFLTVLVLGGMLSPYGLWDSLENSNYDFWAGCFRSPGAQPIVIVAIDEKSMRQLGDWPWSRSKLTEMVQLLSAQGAEALGICVLFTQSDQNPGLMEIRELQNSISEQPLLANKKDIKIVQDLFKEAEERLDQDNHLVTAIRRAKNVVMPLRFTTEPQTGADDAKPSGLLIINSLNAQELPSNTAETPWAMAKAIGAGHPALFKAEGVFETFDVFATKAGALGHMNFPEDPDGVVRRVPLLVQYKGRLAPAFALQVVLKHFGGQLRDLSIDLDFFGQPHLQLKHLQLATDGAYQMLLNYDKQWTRERTFSFSDVLSGAVDPAIFKNKIVFIGVTGPEMSRTCRVAPNGWASTVELTANATARILSPVRLSHPSWARVLELTALLYFAFFLIFLIPKLNIRVGASMLVIFLVTWYAVVTGLLLGYGFRINFLGPVLLTCSGFLLIQATLYSRKRRQEKLEANKALGLSFQGQGMLDMAYEKYMQCPVEDASMKNLLYTLALDFERKRMFNKALAIYQHIGTDGNFKDIDKRSKRLKSLDSTMALSATGGWADTPLLMDDTSAKPTFGRYELLRELGRGSMGTVYLGRDPKINREVAIKTLSYAEVEQDELADVKMRFFREAEAAGKLSHPNIVSIYDVGEEHDMAYIAMELLNGQDLSHFCTKDNLLPVPRAVAIISDVAAALAYAHNQGVVHRDIKPANIMLLSDGRVKVTDFGIAQVVDASKTRTGVILGTPNYMSPEQLDGKNVDGRSDLFSLGIVFYELLAGTKPFKGDSLNAILYAISQNAHTPLAEAVPGIPACCDVIVNKLLVKSLTKRFASADKALKALEACREELQ